MKFTSATITNYKSIKNLTINLEPKGDLYCRVLTGINESGKSNVLKALSFLSKDTKVSYRKDVHKAAKSENKDITVNYELDDSAALAIIEYLRTLECPESLLEKINISSVQRIVQFDSSSARSDYYYMYIDEVDLTEFTFQVSTKKILAIKDVKPDLETLPTKEDITTVLGADYKFIGGAREFERVIEKNFLKTLFEPSLPKIIFWKYEDKYLINKSIDLNTFSADPSGVSKPLQNIFNLAGYNDTQIPVVISGALADSAEMGELADKLATTVTDYLAAVWPEHKVNIKVQTDAGKLDLHIVEHGNTSRYEVAQRSDGFKHFFAILLNFAAENKAEKLKNCLVLLDEPEVHLHPSGTKFLRDELLQVSANNSVVYSTHSIFMIDRKCLGRHYKVTKEGEVTTLSAIDESNPFKEELIYESLGTSILELISEHNILFEGLTDKKLFDTFTYKYRVDLKPLDIHTMSVDGESHFDNYCKFFNKNNVRGYIVADSDKKGSDAKKRILKNCAPEYNDKNTFEINDIHDTKIKATLEDLMPKDIVQQCVKDFCGSTITLADGKPITEQLADFNKANGGGINMQELKSHLCDYVCEDVTKLTKEKAKEKYPDYHDFVERLHEKIKGAN